MTIDDINRRIEELRYEAAHIQHAYKQLATFLHSNAMLPFNDAVVEYLQYFIQEEQTKHRAHADNQEVISNLEKMKADFENHIQVIKESIPNQDDPERQYPSAQRPEDVVNLIQSLYDLPIMGAQLRDQVKSIMLGHEVVVNRHERLVDLPNPSNCSTVLRELTEVVANATIQ